MMFCPRVLQSFSLPLTLVVFCLTCSVTSSAQISHSEQVQITPPLMRSVDPPTADATVADLEMRADQLRSSKLYLDALDYYRAALTKEPKSARLLNKAGITQLM